jgi:hypothetical protein
MSDKLRVRVIRTVPVAAQHNITVGREFDAHPEPNRQRGHGVWVDGDAGEPVKLLRHEYEIVSGEEKDPMP